MNITKNIINDITNAINLLNDNKVKKQECYMTWNKFIKLFPYIYDYVYFDGINWYFKPDIKIYLSLDNCVISDDTIIFKPIERCI